MLGYLNYRKNIAPTVTSRIFVYRKTAMKIYLNIWYEFFPHHLLYSKSSRPKHDVALGVTVKDWKETNLLFRFFTGHKHSVLWCCTVHAKGAFYTPHIFYTTPLPVRVEWLSTFCDFSKSYPFLLIRYIFRRSIPKKRQISQHKIFSFKKSNILVVENFLNPSLYIKEQSPRRKFENKSCL